MDGDVIQLAARQALPIDEVRVRLQRIASILAAIEAGELLAALPSAPAARANHQTGVDLLALAGEQVNALACDLAR